MTSCKLVGLLFMVAFSLHEVAYGQDEDEFVRKYTVKDLVYHAEFGRLERVKKILEQGVDINGFDPDTLKSALIGSIFYEHKNVISYLLSNGADPNVLNKGGFGATQTASESADLDIMAMLFDYGADVSEMRFNSYYTLYEAARTRCHLKTYEKNIRMVLGMGARQVLMSEYFPDYVVIDKRERTPLMVASWCNSLEVVKLLWANGGDVSVKDLSGDTVLHYARKSKKLKIMEFLIKVGADVNASNDGKDTVIHLAFWAGDLERVKLLLKHGALTGNRNNFGRTPLGSAVAGSNPTRDNRRVINLLIKSGSDINSRDSRSRTPLMIAAHFNDTPVNVAKLLIRHGADIQAKDKEGKTALDHAIESGNVEITKLLRAELKKESKGGKRP